MTDDCDGYSCWNKQFKGTCPLPAMPTIYAVSLTRIDIILIGGERVGPFVEAR